MSEDDPVVDIARLTVEFIEFLHSQPGNSAKLNQILYYFKPVHRFVSVSGVLLGFREQILNLKMGATDNTCGVRRESIMNQQNNARHLNPGNSCFGQNLRDIVNYIAETPDHPLSSIKWLKEAFASTPADQIHSINSLPLRPEKLALSEARLVTYLLAGIFNHQFSEPKPFAGIKSMAVLECFRQENLVSFKYLNRVRRVFDRMPSQVGFVDTGNLVIGLINEEEVYDLMCEKVRRPVKGLCSDAEFFDETLSDLLQRIQDESEPFIDWAEFRQYFSYRGQSLIGLFFYFVGSGCWL